MINITKEKVIIGASVGAGVLILLAFFIFYAPLMKELQQKGLAAKAIESQVLQVRSLIESVKSSAEARVLVKEADIAEAQDELAKYCSLMKVSILSLDPKEIAAGQGGQTKVLPIEMKIKAGDQQFAKFIGSLDKLKKSLITLKSLDLSVDPEEKPKLRASLLLLMHIMANAE